MKTPKWDIPGARSVLHESPTQTRRLIGGTLYGMGSANRDRRVDDRLHVLSSALHAFAEATTDYERLLNAVARTVSDVVADGCIVRILSDGGWLTPVAFHFPLEAYVADAGAAAEARTFLTAPRNLAEYAWGQRLMETGEAFMVPRVDVAQFRAVVTPEVATIYETIGIHSMLVVVLRLRGESIGTLTLFRFAPAAPPFDDDDKDMAQALADHAALAIGNARSYAAEREARVAVEASEARYRLMFDNSPLPKWIYDVETLRFLDVNAAAVREYGYSRDEFLSMTICDIRPPEDVAALLEAERRAELPPKFGVWRLRKKSGETIQVELTKHTFVLANRPTRVTVGRDVTERLRLEEQLRQAQKMEAVGRLAGGVAHDLNNILSVILSCSDMLLADLKSGDPMRADVDEIHNAGTRATDLTRQLLMFSRQQVLAPKVFDLNDVLASMDKMLQRILGADIDLLSIPTQPLGRVRADRSNIEQVIMNPVVNARDAMPTGGKLTMETANVVLDDFDVADECGGLPAGKVEDLFAPYTQRGTNRSGVGLGLSICLKAAKANHGEIGVRDLPGKGCVFTLDLPRRPATHASTAGAAGRALPSSVASRIAAVDGGVEAPGLAKARLSGRITARSDWRVRGERTASPEAPDSRRATGAAPEVTSSWRTSEVDCSRFSVTYPPPRTEWRARVCLGRRRRWMREVARSNRVRSRLGGCAEPSEYSAGGPTAPSRRSACARQTSRSA